MHDITRELERLEAGGDASSARLLTLVYDELRKLAAARLANEAPGQTLQATALVHEAWLRLLPRRAPRDSDLSDGSRDSNDFSRFNDSAHSDRLIDSDDPADVTEPNVPSGAEDSPRQPVWNSRGHFFAAAAEAMRRILVENARRKQRLKHGGGAERVDLDVAQVEIEAPVGVREDLIALDEALDRLAAVEPEAARLVQLRYFAGLSIPEIATTLGISPRGADRLWAYARAWLHRALRSERHDA